MQHTSQSRCRRATLRKKYASAPCHNALAASSLDADTSAIASRSTASISSFGGSCMVPSRSISTYSAGGVGVQCSQTVLQTLMRTGRRHEHTYVYILCPLTYMTVFSRGDLEFGSSK